MGLFTPRPEEPTEWAGLPSEPLSPTSEIEALGAPIVSSDALNVLGAGAQSIVIPLTPTGASPRTATDPADPSQPASG